MPRTSRVLGFGQVVFQGAAASRPAASTVPVGSIAVFADLGPGTSTNRRSWWWSDGTYWRPVGGRQYIDVQAGSIAAPVATLTGTGAIQAFVLPRDLLIPAGLLFPGALVEVICVMEKNGVHTGGVHCTLDTTASPATPTTNDVQTVTSNAGSPSTVRLTNQFGIYSGGWMEPQATAVFTTGSSAGVWAAHADANILTQDRYIGFSLAASYTDSAANILLCSVALMG